MAGSVQVDVQATPAQGWVSGAGVGLEDGSARPTLLQFGEADEGSETVVEVLPTSSDLPLATLQSSALAAYVTPVKSHMGRLGVVHGGDVDDPMVIAAEEDAMMGGLPGALGSPEGPGSMSL
jgi:hypothetical protein